MNVFYNREGIGDTLIVKINELELQDRAVERNGDVARVYHNKTNETAGYNIFNASTYFTVSANGLVDLTEELAEKINETIEKSGFKKVEVDLSPKFVVGYVESKEKHPDADKLNVCQVNVGNETLQIVCGAPNVDQGQKVVVAKVGAVMPSGMEIKDAELRGVASSGMICSAKELALPDAPKEKGILVLEDNAEIGKPFLANK
ncbi:YtpR family tRNA-binding protein [Priestia filamentosa]|uniref:YtpR family tRNA-binding protein n=1 Tax=Priestia filamentosa TaxID=1402861 RepID=UPI0039821EC1